MDINQGDQGPMDRIRDLAGRGRIWIRVKGRQAIQKSRESIIYKSTKSLALQSTHRLYAVWRSTVDYPSLDHPARGAVPIPTNDNTPLGQLSGYHLLAQVFKGRLSPSHALLHYMSQCPCQDLDAIAASTSSRFPLYTDENGTGGDFDRVDSNVRFFMKLKLLPRGQDSDLCVVMKHTTSLRLYVIKIVSNPMYLTSGPTGQQTSNEAYILLGKLKTNIHPQRNITQMYDCIRSEALPKDSFHVLQMEHCSRGDLRSLNERCIASSRYLPTAFTNHIFSHLIEGLAYLHHGIYATPEGKLMRTHLVSPTDRPWEAILHNDIRPENILLRFPPTRWRAPTSTAEEVYPDIVLADFALAGVAGEGKPCTHARHASSAPEIRDAIARQTAAIHRLRFRAADAVAAEGSHTAASDVWAVGAVMYTLAAQKDIAEWHRGEEGRKQDFEALKERYGGELWIWVRKCMGRTPLGRPTALKLLEVAVPVLASDGKGKAQELPGWVWGR